MTTGHPKTDFNSIAQNFVMNLRSLRVFNDRIGAAAVEHDRLAIDSFLNACQTLMPEGALSVAEEEEAIICFTLR